MEHNTKCCESKKYADDIDQVKEKLSLTVQKCIKNLVQKEKFKHYQIEVTDFSTNGGNYLGVLQTVDVKGEGPEGDKEINLFVKNIVHSDDFNHFPLDELYLRESFIYKDVLAVYNKLQDEHNIPDGERFKSVQCYSPLNSEAIILENMSKKGFETNNRRDVISLKFAELSIAQLAKYHALSFVVQDKQPNYFEKNIKSIKALINFESDWPGLLRKSCNIAMEGLDEYGKRKLDNHYPTLVEKYEEYFKRTVGDHKDAVCLCHLDYRLNNILQKTVNGEVAEIVAIDYQFVSFTSPVLDLIYFIFSGTNQKFRDTHMEYLKKHYYDTFETFLGYFGISSSNVYSRKRFEIDFEEKLDFGLLIFILLLPLLFAADDDVQDVHSIMDSRKHVTIDKENQKRTREVVEFFIQRGNIN